MTTLVDCFNEKKSDEIETEAHEQNDAMQLAFRQKPYLERIVQKRLAKTIALRIAQQQEEYLVH